MSRLSKFFLIIILIAVLLACNFLTKPVKDVQNVAKTAESIVSAIPLETLQSQPSLTSEPNVLNTPSPSQNNQTMIEEDKSPRWYLLNRPGGLLSQGAKLSISPLNSQYRYLSLPANPYYLYNERPSDGLLVSTDGGLTWTNRLSNLLKTINTPIKTLQSNAIADPANEKAVFLVVDTNLYLSEDNGASWRLLLTLPEILDFALGSDGQTIYVLSNSSAQVSRDRGQSWSGNTDIIKDAALSPVVITAHSLAVDTQEPTIAYAVLGGKLFVTNDAGKSWTIPSFLSSVSAVKVFADQKVTKLAYMVSLEESLYRTTDGGVSWGFVADLSQYTHYSDIFFANVFEASNNFIYYANNFDCDTALIISGDQGNTWKKTAVLPHLSWDFGNYVGETCPTIFSITLEDNLIWNLSGYGSPVGSKTDLLTAMSSNDMGQTWQLTAPLYYQNHIAASKDGKVMYLSGYYVFKTEDSGNTWQGLIKNYSDWFSYYDIDVSSQNPNIAYVGASNWNEINVLKTQDGGNSWEKIISGTEDVWRTCVYTGFGELLAVNPANDKYVYLSKPGMVVIDGTLNPLFPLAQSGCAITDLYRIAFAPNSSLNILFSPGDGLYSSTDGGVTSQQRGLGNDFHIGAIAFDPNDSNKVYAMANANYHTSLFMSNDGGGTWNLAGEFSENEVASTNLFVDPRDSKILYLLSEGTAYRSLDGGTTWELFATGISPSEYLFEMVLVNSNPPRLFAVGVSGVWRIELP